MNWKDILSNAAIAGIPTDIAQKEIDETTQESSQEEKENDKT